MTQNLVFHHLDLQRSWKCLEPIPARRLDRRVEEPQEMDRLARSQTRDLQSKTSIRKRALSVHVLPSQSGLIKPIAALSLARRRRGGCDSADGDDDKPIGSDRKQLVKPRVTSSEDAWS
ncbi:unnamed protein product [Pleuronectes platessa]|uniref:Uncharacterized protein n=1 Tax=Pleuronectes platessa TaxID=8262 RepID=A0A9N7YXV8_PLEPL|nr:unnamed protein product [Pleuronectes platessa]